MIVYHFAQSSGDAEQLVHALVGDIVSISAQLWARLEVRLQQFPWKLLSLVNPRVDDTVKQAVRHEFCSCPLCELDVGFSLPLRSQLRDERDLQREDVFGMLHRLARIVKSTSMDLERLLAKITASVRHNRHKPSAERVVHSGFLAQAMERHILKGGQDQRRETVRDLVKVGVPVRANKRARTDYQSKKGTLACTCNGSTPMSLSTGSSTRECRTAMPGLPCWSPGGALVSCSVRSSAQTTSPPAPVPVFIQIPKHPPTRMLPISLPAVCCRSCGWMLLPASVTGQSPLFAWVTFCRRLLLHATSVPRWGWATSKRHGRFRQGLSW